MGSLHYRLATAARVAWFTGQSLAANRLARALGAEGGAPKRAAAAQAAIDAALKRGMTALFARDLEHIEAGLYPMPEDLRPRPLAAVRGAVRFFEDLPRTTRRRREGRHADLPKAALDGRYPRYYLQNFHYQTDGWLSERSARLYDHQVEVLFTGCAAAMRRQALPLIRRLLHGRDLRRARLADVACGTGAFLAQVKATWPQLAVTGIDLSPAYLAASRRQLARFGRCTLAQAKAEALPFADGSFDVVTCVYLMHELPPAIRAQVAAELARIIRPGGGLVLLDALQMGDEAAFDPLLENFPRSFHEPYFTSYARTDLAALFGAVGLDRSASVPAFLSKALLFERR